MKLFKICLGVFISLCIWTAVILISIPHDNSDKYQKYIHFPNIESALVEFDNDYRLDYRIEKPYCVLSGSQTYDKDLIIISEKLVITGDIVINGRLELYKTELIIEGSLTVDYIVTDNLVVATVKNNGYLDVFDIDDVKFFNYGEAFFDYSRIEDYTLSSSSKLIIKHQSPNCVVNLEMAGVYLNLRQSPIEIVDYLNDYIIIKDKSGLALDYDTYIEKICQSNIDFNIVLIILGAVVLLNIVIGLSCMLYTFKKSKKNIENIEIYAADANISYFKGNIFTYTFFKAGIVLLNIITLMLIKPYSDELFYKWKWKRTVLFGKKMEFTAEGGQIFYKNLLWVFLTFITLGIYSYKYTFYYMNWITSGISYSGAKQINNTYAIDEKEVRNYILSSIIWFLALYVVPFFAVIVILSIVKSAWIMQLLLIVLYISMFIFISFVAYKIYNNYIDIVWNSLVINGKALCSKHIDVKTFIRYFLLGIVSLDGYYYTVDYKLYCLLVENT